ncbi:MAG: oligoribonuclease, partial [Gammaproteobacteria bacterium]|nr:oligoribonuclease [Gammaproteobacteria bacterium]
MSDAPTNSDRAGNLIWIDLEMTGLDTEADTIIEIATIVTDRHLNELAAGPELAIGQPQGVMDSMDEWNTRQHRESGLTERVLQSDVTMRQAELQTLNFLSQWVDAGASPMSGNSICQDRRFLAREMPELERYFHYRNLDVSTLKILAQQWAPEVAA